MKRASWLLQQSKLTMDGRMNETSQAGYGFKHKQELRGMSCAVKNHVTTQIFI